MVYECFMIYFIGMRKKKLNNSIKTPEICSFDINFIGQ